MCYMEINVSKPFYYSLCVTCRSVYLHIYILHSVFNVNQCIYNLLFFTLCNMLINVSTSFFSSLCVTCRSLYLLLTILHYVSIYLHHYILHSVSKRVYATYCATYRPVYLHCSKIQSVL